MSTTPTDTHTEPAPAVSLTEAERDHIESLLDAFDFERVHRAMIALNWKWAGAGGGDKMCVPEVRDLRKHARELLRDVDPNSTGSCGGFYATRFSEGKGGGFELSFRIDSLSVDNDGQVE